MFDLVRPTKKKKQELHKGKKERLRQKIPVIPKQ